VKTIPFLPRFIPLIRSQRKTVTCRTRKYGAPGDRMIAGSEAIIELISITQCHLSLVYRDHWLAEGVCSPLEFAEIWKGLHGGVFDPERIVWLHRFTFLRDVTAEDAAADGGRK